MDLVRRNLQEIGTQTFFDDFDYEGLGGKGGGFFLGRGVQRLERRRGNDILDVALRRYCGV